FTRWYRLRACRNHRLDILNGRSGFQSRVVTGTNPQQHNVIVIVDQTERDCAPAQVDGPGAGAGAHIALAITRDADCRESAVLDDDLGDDSILPVHGHDPAVGEMQIARAGAASVLSVNHADPGCYDKYKPTSE